MESKLVSIVIPVYNAEKYIVRCLESLQLQSYKNFECILVDDGSKDNSKLLINDISQKDLRFRYIYQENSGPSAARNRGMQEANGEYLIFIDADDYIRVDYIEQLVCKIEQGFDLVCCGYHDISKYGTILWNDFNSSDFTKENLIHCTIRGTGGVLWGKIFRTSIVKYNNIQLDERLFMCEDMIFVLQYIEYVNKWCSIPQNLYYYNRLNESSISKKINDKYLDNYENFFKRLIEELKKSGVADLTLEEYSNKKVAETLTNLIRLSREKRTLILGLKKNDFWSMYFKNNSERNFIMKLAFQEKIFLLNTYIFMINSLQTVGGNVKRFIKRMIK